MLRLYYGPNACSLASHIAIEESGLAFERTAISIFDGEQKSPAYLARVPTGKVPALEIDGHVLTENVAIQAYVAAAAPSARLMPDDPLSAAVALSRLAWFSNSVHISFRHMMRPMVLTSEEAAHAGIAARGKEDFLDSLRRIEAMLQGGPWLMGDRFTLCDGYAMVFFNWASFAGLDLSPLPALRRHAARMIERPAVARVLTIEGSLDRIADAVR